MEEALAHLRTNDSLLAKLIKKYGKCPIAAHTDYYATLLSSIIGQQLSEKVASVIENRVKSLYGGILPSPQQIIDTDAEVLRTLGVSYGKISYIKDLAAKILADEVDLEHISSLSNQEIIDELTQVKGIGVWTAHMFLIFCLGRLDVLPTGDLGIRKAVQNTYGHADLASAEDIEAVASENNWSPYQSVACWYLWQSLENSPKS